MAIRALSGNLATRGHRSGNVNIHLPDHTITGTLTATDVSHKREFGPRRRFNRPPCKHVALREFRIVETDEAWPTGRTERFKVVIDDTLCTETNLEIKWDAEGGSQIEEITYLVIGEVD